MKALKLVAVWNEHRAPLSRSDMFLTRVMNGRGKTETSATKKLIRLSEQFERENLSFTSPPESCTSCRGNDDLATKDWVPGHRPNWWVCKQCKTVLPCRCSMPNETGHCRDCGRKMNWDAVLLYRLEIDQQKCDVKIAELDTMFFGPPRDAFPGFSDASGW